MAHLEMSNDDPNGFWDGMVNMLESYRVFVEDMGRIWSSSIPIP